LQIFDCRLKILPFGKLLIVEFVIVE